METAEFRKMLCKAMEQTMADNKLKESLVWVSPLASHAHNSPRELEHGFLEKICQKMNRRLNQWVTGDRKLFLVPLLTKDKEKEEGLTVSVFWSEADPPVVVGQLEMWILFHHGSLDVRFLWTLDESFERLFPFTHHLYRLKAPADSTALPTLSEEENLLIFIDLEWVSCYKGVNEKHGVDPGQISEFSFMTAEEFYYSGYLKVTSTYLKRMHKKLLAKMNITPEEMQNRHWYGSTFMEEWEDTLVPILDKFSHQTAVFLSFGTEDGKILRELFSPTQLQKTKFIDVSGHYHIFNFGQMALLNGLGVTFTHDFSSDMDVKALYLIYDIFRHCKTVEDSRNLQLALQLRKMMLYSQEEKDKEKLEYYLSILLREERTRFLFENAIAFAEEMVKDGYFIPNYD